MKKICIFLLFCVIFAAAELINGVAIIVNNEPITLYEINKTAKELYGIDNFTDMVGDESIATDPEALVEFLTEKGHPALSMDPMM